MRDQISLIICLLLLLVSTKMGLNAPDNISHERPTGNKSHQSYLRWDHADLNSYYLLTGQRLQTLLNDITSFENNNCVNEVATDKSRSRFEITSFVENVYNTIVTTLCSVANVTVPIQTVL